MATDVPTPMDVKQEVQLPVKKGAENGNQNLRGQPRGPFIPGFRGAPRGQPPPPVRGVGVGRAIRMPANPVNVEFEVSQQNNDRGGFSGRGGPGSRGRGRGNSGMVNFPPPNNQHDYHDVKFAPMDRVLEKLKQISGPQLDLSPKDDVIRKFSNHCRLWVGNLPNDLTDEQLKEVFKPYGEFDEVYLDKAKGFAFIRLDFKSNAERAKQELDGTDIKGKDMKNRPLKIRFSTPNSVLKVRNLSQWVTNELLEKAFSVFGELEKCIVVTDERGRTTGEGIIEFCKKPSALACLKKCSEGCFFLTASPCPVIVEMLTQVDDNEGLQEVNINKRNPDYTRERQQGPRFAHPGSFEFEYGIKWKQLYELFDKKKEALDKELQDEKNKLGEQIEYAKYEHETELLREQLRQREEMNLHNKQTFEQRQRDWEDRRRVEDERTRRVEEELSVKFRKQEEELRRRQEENRLFMQDRAEMLQGEDDGYDGSNWQGHGMENYSSGGSSNWRGAGGENWSSRGGRSNRGHSSGGYETGSSGELPPPPDPQTFLDNFSRGREFEDKHEMRGRGSNRSRWGRVEQEGGAPIKRPRF